MNSKYMDYTWDVVGYNPVTSQLANLMIMPNGELVKLC